jgi:hypothetical protein
MGSPLSLHYGTSLFSNSQTCLHDSPYPRRACIGMDRPFISLPRIAAAGNLYHAHPRIAHARRLPNEPHIPLIVIDGSPPVPVRSPVYSLSYLKGCAPLLVLAESSSFLPCH